MTLYLDLISFSSTGSDPADNELLRRVDRRVAGYYLAVPIAGEDDRVTVATAYPENKAALRVLERLLGLPVVPVASPENAVREAIDRIYPQSAAAGQAILAWSDDPAWLPAVSAAAEAFGQALGQDVHLLGATPLDQVIAAGDGAYALLAAHATGEEAMRRLVRRSAISLLLVRGEYVPIERILVVLRGYGSDHKTLESILPFLSRHRTEATILPLARSASAPLNELLAGDAPAQLHLNGFLSELPNDADVEIRLCQGDPAAMIVEELANGGYQMLAIAAEGEGQFVGETLARIEREQSWPGGPVLVVRPPVNPLALLEEQAPGL
jgi:hypothetical protein